MNEEFKKIKLPNETRYVLETTTAGATGTGSIATAEKPLGELQKRQTVSVPVNQKPRQGPMKSQTGAGAHRDKKKEQKQGKEKHRKPFDEEQGVAEGDEPGYIKYEQMKDKISSVLIKLYNQGKDPETIKQMGDRVAQHLGYDPEDSIFQDAWMTSFTDASLDGSLDQDDEDDYTDYSMRRGERGMEEGDDQPDHEISMASNELQSIMSDAKKLLVLIKRYSEMEGLEAWQQSKITKSADYLTAVLRSIGGEQGALESQVNEYETHTYKDSQGNVWRVNDEGEKELVKSASGGGYGGSRYGSRYPSRSYSKPSGMYFYNVKPGQENDAQSAGLKQSKSGKWYSTYQNSQADKLFGPGKFWQPKNEASVAEEKQKGVDGKACWKGYKRMGTKKKGGRTVDNCVPVGEDSYIESLMNQLYEKAPPGDKYERIVKHIKAGYRKDGKLTDVEKRKAYGAAWKAKNKSKK